MERYACHVSTCGVRLDDVDSVSAALDSTTTVVIVFVSSPFCLLSFGRRSLVCNSPAARSLASLLCAVCLSVSLRVPPAVCVCVPFGAALRHFLYVDLRGFGRVRSLGWVNCLGGYVKRALRLGVCFWRVLFAVACTWRATSRAVRRVACVQSLRLSAHSPRWPPTGHLRWPVGGRGVVRWWRSASLRSGSSSIAQ